MNDKQAMMFPLFSTLAIFPVQFAVDWLCSVILFPGRF